MAPELPPPPLHPQRPAACSAPYRTKEGFEALPQGRLVLTGPVLGWRYSSFVTMGMRLPLQMGDDVLGSFGPSAPHGNPARRGDHCCRLPVPPFIQPSKRTGQLGSHCGG